MRMFIKISFLLLASLSLILGIISFENKEWETLTASISLIISIISGWIAYETFHRQALSEKPQIILRLDFKSRYDLILLVAENLGAKPAFNIKFKWNEDLLDLKGHKINFNSLTNDVDIPVLNTKESTSAIIDLQSSFFTKRKNKNLDFSGFIFFQESLNSKRLTSYPFYFSFKHYSHSPSFDNEETKTLYELQKIPTELNKIKDELNRLSKIFDNKKNIEH